MKEKTATHGGYWWLTAAATLYYAGCGVYSYLSVYLKTGPGFSTAQIGILLALGQVVSTMAPLFWGYVADHARNRNHIWILLILASGLSALLVPISTRFTVVALTLLLVNCFQSAVVSLQDSVSTELCARHGWDLGRSRTWGTLAFALTTFAVGAYLATDSWEFFGVYALIYALSAIPVCKLPPVPGYQNKPESKVPYKRLFEDKALVFIFVATFVMTLTTSFYYSFFSIYFISDTVGGTTAQFGLCNALASVAEFPMMLVLSKVIRKKGLETTLGASFAFLALRWLLIGVVTNPVAIIVINMLHGISYAMAGLCIILYINERVRPEFRASAQGFNIMLDYGITRVIASLAGGFLSEAFSFSAIFVTMGIVMAALTVVYAFGMRRFSRS